MPRRILTLGFALLAACNGTIGDTPPTIETATPEDPPAVPFEAVPPEVYVAKVKNVLTGLPPTDDEVARVTQDPTQLSALVDTWFDTPEAQLILRSFYGNLFQQSQVIATDLETPLGQMGANRFTPDFVEQVRNSFPITVQHLVSDGKPFTETVTTTTVWMTPPMMAYYLIADDFVIPDDVSAANRIARHPTADGNVRAVWEYHDPADTAGAWTLADTLNPSSPHYMHFMMSKKLTCTYGMRTYDSGHDKDPKYAHPVMDPADPNHTKVQVASIDIPRVIIDPTNISPITGKVSPLSGSPELRIWTYFSTGTVILPDSSEQWSRGGYVPDSLTIPAGTPTAVAATYRTSCPNWQSGTPPVFDFSDGSPDTEFRAITIEPSTEADPVGFWDVLALRNPHKTTLKLRTQRVGFFSTPAFISTFPSNASNDSRGIANQSLIVALGLSINPVDKGGIVVFDTGNDAEHSDPSSACYTCHATLDPLRDVFVKSWNYAGGEQTNATKTALTSTFDYQGETATPNTLADYADVLVNHPLYAQAVVQKLCYYASSAPCSEDDPEFLQIADDFKTSGYDFRSLVRELLSSPLITSASESQTIDDRGEVVSIARYGHFCASLTARTGLAQFMGDPSYDVCSGVGPAALGKTALAAFKAQVPLVASNIPSDGFARGAEAPLLPTDSTMFFRSAVETMCNVAANFTVDLPGSRYSSAAPDVAIADMVTNVIGLTSADPAHDGAVALVKTHYANALSSGASPSEALRSSFVLACTSPTSVSVGL